VPNTEIIEVRPASRNARRWARPPPMLTGLGRLRRAPAVRGQAALRASRRVNDFPTAVRIFEGLKNKINNDKIYQQYVTDLRPVIDELGVTDNQGRPL